MNFFLYYMKIVIYTFSGKTKKYEKNKKNIYIKRYYTNKQY